MFGQLINKFVHWKVAFLGMPLKFNNKLVKCALTTKHRFLSRILAQWQSSSMVTSRSSDLIGTRRSEFEPPGHEDKRSLPTLALLK